MAERSLWWFRNATDDGKHVMIFDPGYEGGDLHIYTHEKSVPGEEVQKRAEDELKHNYEPSYRGQALGELEFSEAPDNRWRVQD